MKVLLDTCVISELKKKSPQISVKEFVAKLQEHETFLSVLTVGEINKGINLLEDSSRKQDLIDWLQGLQQDYSDRVLPLDQETGMIWGEISAKVQRQGKILPGIDGLIAATAIRHGLHLITRDITHFESTGIMVINPWQ